MVMTHLQMIVKRPCSASETASDIMKHDRSRPHNWIVSRIIATWNYIQMKKTRRKYARMGPGDGWRRPVFVFFFLVPCSNSLWLGEIYWCCQNLWLTDRYSSKSLRSPPGCSRASPHPKKTGVCLLYCFVLSPLISLGAVPHHHLALSVKELTYSSNS